MMDSGYTFIDSEVLALPSSKRIKLSLSLNDVKAQSVSKQHLIQQLVASVRLLLSSWTLEKYLSTQPPRGMICLRDEDTIGEALRIFARHQILSAPCFDQQCDKYLGFVDIKSIMKTIFEVVDIRTMGIDDRECKLYGAGHRLSHTKLRDFCVGDDGLLIHKDDQGYSLLEVVQNSFLDPNSKARCHRVAVFRYADDEDGEPDRDDGDGDDPPRRSPLHDIIVTHLISHTDILRFIHRHSTQLGPVYKSTLQELGYARKGVVCVPADMPTINAFATMLREKVGSVGVVVPGKGLVGNLSASDLRGIEVENFGLLAKPVKEFLEGAVRRNLVPERSAGTNHYGVKGFEALKQIPLYRCYPDTLLSDVIDVMITNHIHRQYVVERGSNRAVGIVTITDLLHLLLQPSAGKETSE